MAYINGRYVQTGAQSQAPVGDDPGTPMGQDMTKGPNKGKPVDPKTAVFGKAGEKECNSCSHMDPNSGFCDFLQFEVEDEDHCCMWEPTGGGSSQDDSVPQSGGAPSDSDGGESAEENY